MRRKNFDDLSHASTGVASEEETCDGDEWGGPIGRSDSFCSGAYTPPHSPTPTGLLHLASGQDTGHNMRISSQWSPPWAEAERGEGVSSHTSSPRTDVQGGWSGGDHHADDNSAQDANLIKGPWTQEDDCMLILMVQAFGTKRMQEKLTRVGQELCRQEPQVCHTTTW